MIEYTLNNADAVRAIIIRGALDLHLAARNAADAARPAVVVPASSLNREVIL